MPIFDSSHLRSDVAQHFAAMSKTNSKINRSFALRYFFLLPKLSRLSKKMAQFNVKFIDKQIKDHSIINNEFTFKESLFLATKINLLWNYSAKKYRQIHPPPSEVLIEENVLNGVKTEWYLPKNALNHKIILNFHGGGYCVGSVNYSRLSKSILAQRLNRQIVSVDYRLAPKYPFPAQLDDSLQVYRWLLAHNYDPQNIVLSGESAGGHLVLSTLLKMKMENLPLPSRCILISPCTDMTFSDSSFFENAVNDPILGAEVSVGLLLSSFLNGQPPDQPLVSPLFGDLRDLPPLLFIVSTSEMLYSDSVRFVEKAKKSGVIAILKAYDNMVHCFPNYHYENAPWPEIDQSINEMVKFLGS